MSLQLQTASVRIFNMKGVVVGTGFLVEKSIVLTCAHVVAGALGISEKELKRPDESIFLDFPLLAAGERCTARIRSWHPVQENGGGDIAILQVEGPLPDGARGVRLVAANDLWGHTFRAFGFPQAHDSGVWTSGRILAGEATGWIQIEDIKITGKRVQQGFSGGAVWDEQLDGVVGMIVAADEDSSKVAYLIPTRSLLEQVSALDHSAIPPCPYRGLSAFREQDEPYFFGRAAFIQQLVSNVSKRSLVAITGPSGSGKSSVLSAGLIPHLRREGIWLIASFRPGSSPFWSLAAALQPLLVPHLSGTDRLVETKKLSRSLQQGEISLRDVIEDIIIKNNDQMRLLLAIDQFEELYASGQEQVICQRFLDELLGVKHMAPVETLTCSIVFTLRSDFLGQVLSSPPIAHALQDATLKISPMSRAELENAIIQPAQKLNVKTEDGLVRRILQDMSQQQDYYLPLLSFALQLLWAKQKGNKLTHAAYNEIGGVEKVIADYAEEIYAGLSEEERLKAQQVFVQLVQPGVGTEDSRRLASRTEIGEGNWQLVMRLSSTARLLVIGRDEITGEETVEVIHEALILNWWRLREWIEKNREFRTWQESLRTAVRQWEKAGRDDDALLHSELLVNAIDWLTKHSEVISSQERIFIEASQRRAQEANEKIERKPLPASSRRIPKRKAGQVSPSSQETVPSPDESAIAVTRTFIGRAKELMQLEEWLTRTDPEAPWIMYLHDAVEDTAKKGGVGKTWLLRQFAQRVRMTHADIVTVPIDFFNLADREGVAVANRVVNALKAAYPHWSPRAFDETLVEYRDTLQGGKENVVEVRDRLADALTVDLRSLDKQLQEKRTYLLVLCDTYEMIEQNPITAVLGSSQTFPDNYHFEHMRVVIAGRNALDWTHPNWKGRRQEVQTIALSPFGQEEMQEYVEMASTYNISIEGKQAKELYERTEGRPILIGLAIDVLNHHILTLDDLLAVPRTEFESYLISQINNLENLLNWIILFMAHGYQRFNMSILQRILQSSPALSKLTQSINNEMLLSKLSELSFVRSSNSGNDFVLHDEMRRLVRKYCWDVQDPTLNIRKEISRSVISYFEQEITHAQDESQRQAYIIEVLYHRLFIDRADGMHYFQQCFQRALDTWQIPYARQLFQEIAKFENDTYLTLAQRNDITLAEAKLLLSEEDAIRALDLYEDLELEADRHWIKDHQADILLEKGKCYLRQGNYLDAAASFIQSLEFEKIQSKWPQRPIILGWLGYSHYLRGQFDIALGHYEESVALLRQSENAYEYANVLAGISLIHRLQGNIFEALKICKFALRIYTDLSRQGQTGEMAVGFSLIILGQIYLDLDDIMQAERCFQDAFSIDNRTGRKKGLVATYYCFGQIQMAKGDLQQAHQWFEKARGAFSGIDTYTDISILNKQARILTQQGRWREALLFFEQAIHLAWQTYDDYQRTESLIGLAEAAAALGQKQRSVQLLHEAEEIAHRWNYLRFLGLVEEIRGNISYKAREYQAAFIYYSQFCHYMARYNVLAYNKALRKIIDCLFDVPRDDAREIIDSCTTYWQAHNLDNLYPDFVVALEEQRTLLAL